MAGWDTLDNLVREEVVQRGQEGCAVSGFAVLLDEAGQDEAYLMALYAELMALPAQTDFPYSEPDDWEAIQSERPHPQSTLNKAPDEKRLPDQMLGAWLGRCAGCALGKPLEYEPYMSGTAETPGWKFIQQWFEGADAWPIDGYVPQHSRAEADGLVLAPWGKGCERENLRAMVTDDDLRYTVLGLLLLEEKGLAWDSWDVGKHWHRYLTYQQMCTAETQAYLNFAHCTAHMRGTKPADWAARQRWVRTYLNPYREWIGAQIRVDALAYGAAGNPQRAAELAYRDASFSHVKNGVYGAMFTAAMIAAAFVETDAERIVATGLAEIPRNCRLAEVVQQAVAIARAADDSLDLVSRVWEAFKHYNAVHTINNTALVAAALVFARGDFQTAITTAVLGGWDTDCNGATVGSIMGAVLGGAALPEAWIAPLNDTLYAEVTGFHPIAISECARRSYQTWQRIQRGL